MRSRVAMVALVCVLSSAGWAGKVTTDPNTGGARPAVAPTKIDTRLAKKITYKVKLKPMSTIVEDLSEMTNVKFLAGKSVSDWRVREDCATIHAVDIPLAHLMDSIARVMKMAWIKSGAEPNWTYRLVEDARAIREIKELEAARKRENAAKRREVLEQVYRLPDMTEQQLKKLREDNPELYIKAKTGLAGPMAEFLRAAPEVTQAWLEGSEFKMPASRLSPQAYQALADFSRKQMTLGSTLHAFPDDEEFYTRELANLGQTLAKARVEVWRGSASDPYGGISFGVSGIHISQPRDEVHKLYGKLALRVFEEKRPYREVAKEMRDEIRKAREANPNRRPWHYTGEDYLVTADQPYLHEKIRKKIDSDTRSGLAFELAEATGLAVVTDDFRGRSHVRIDEKREVGDTIRDVADQNGLNWRRQHDAIELWNRDWYRLREGRVPKAWLEAKIAKIKETGTLEIEDLAEIAALTDDQINQNISRSRSLSTVVGTVRKHRDYLKLYGSFTREQRAMLFSQAGLSLAALTAAQQEDAVEIFSGLDLEALKGVDLHGLGLRVRMSKSKKESAIVYTMTGWTLAGPVPGERVFTTPVYCDPHRTSP